MMAGQKKMSGKEFNCTREKFISTRFLSHSIYDKRGGLLHKRLSHFVQLFLPQSSVVKTPPGAGMPKESRPSQTVDELHGKCGSQSNPLYTTHDE